MHEQDIHQRIDALLAELDQSHNDENPSSLTPPRIIDVYIVERTAETEASPTVESTLVPEQDMSQSLNEEPPTPSPLPSGETPVRRFPRWMLVASVCVVCAILLGAGATSYLLSVFTPSATITIVTHAHALTISTTLSVVTHGTADPTKQQVPGRVLPSVTMSQQQTVPTTGITHQQAQVAHGFITFYNGATYAQTIPAGTLLTGTDGIPLVTNADATIPAALFPTFGQTSVSAHAALIGPEGNVRAGDVYGACCRLNVSAVNGAFTGGQDAQSYPSVTQMDITNVATSMKTSLDQSIQAALQTQVHANEALLTPLTCASKTTPDHQVGEEATQVEVLMSETCTGITYDTQELMRLATQSATQDAAHRLGTGYTTTGVQSHVIKTTPSNHGMVLQVQSVSLWAYLLSQQQQDHIKALIVGMSKDKATATLLHLPAVQSVSITIQHGTIIPKNRQQIDILFLQV